MTTEVANMRAGRLASRTPLLFDNEAGRRVELVSAVTCFPPL
jgi:hypothetical protein